MKLESISVNHHKVLGSTKINLFGDSEPLKEDILKEHHTDIHVEVSKTSGENHYTYIIGQNGIGKTLLFRSIIHFINWNNKYKDTKISDLINLFNKSGKYRRFVAEDLGYYELSELGIYNKYFFRKDTENYDFLNLYDSQLISISSSFERNIIHKNPRFRSFNYTSEINKIEVLFLKSLIKFHDQKELLLLSDLLDRKNTSWSLQCELAIDAMGGINDNTYTILLKNKNGINIINFLKTIKKIKLNEKKQIEEGSLETDEVRVFEAIYNSGAFFKLYYESNSNFSELFERINSGLIVKKIESFLSDRTDSTNVEESLNVRIGKDQKIEWESLFSKPEELSEFDALTIGLLQSLNLVDLNIFCNDVPIDRMSSGEQSIIRLFSFFSDLPVKESKENLIVFFDEPENSLHPKWQQNFPIYFKKIVEEVYQIKNSHFLFATHSPLVIMKAASIQNSNVLHFSKDIDNAFVSKQIQNINSFSVEEVLLDDFKISYRDREMELTVEKILKDKSKGVKENSDPINSIEKSFELRAKINDLFNKLNSEQ